VVIPDVAALHPGYVFVISAATRCGRYFHCKEQLRSKGSLVSATDGLRH
jgi:hypothetical protein